MWRYWPTQHELFSTLSCQLHHARYETSLPTDFIYHANQNRQDEEDWIRIWATWAKLEPGKHKAITIAAAILSKEGRSHHWFFEGVGGSCWILFCQVLAWMNIIWIPIFKWIILLLKNLSGSRSFYFVWWNKIEKIKWARYTYRTHTH